MLIDTHCHLIDEAFASDVEACIVRAQEAGVGQMVLACCDETEFPQILELCAKHPGVLYPSIGIHPENMAADVDEQLDKIQQLLEDYLQAQTEASEQKGQASTEASTQYRLPIGEIGIDLHWDKTRLPDQIKILCQQLEWASRYDLPVLLHIRDAMPEFLRVLERLWNDRHGAIRLRGILHCYSGTALEAREAMKYGDFYIGIGGTVTYKKSLVPEVAKAVGLERIVLETDAPYLAPVPERGHRNEPAFTAHTARYLATLFETTPEQVAEVTTSNARRLLGL